MPVGFDPERWSRLLADYSAWWRGELERPLVHITIRGRDPGRPEPSLPAYGFHSFYDLSVPAEEIVDRWDWDLSRSWYLGDAFPHVMPNFGPGVIAAFCGAQLINGNGTVWFLPSEKREITELNLEPQPENPWLARVSALVEAATERWGGQVQIGHTDLGGNLDILASFRPGPGLLLDLHDYPDDVKRLTAQVHELWWHYYTYFDHLQRPPNPGCTCWTPILSEGPYYMLQCDFAYMIGPEMFDEFVKPDLEATARRLTNAFYHLDGPGQLPHLDSLLSIDAIKGIQWVPGAGQPDVAHWPEVFRRIREAGKLIQVFGGQYCGGWRILDVLAEQLGSAQGICLIADAPQSEETEVREMLRRYGCPQE